MTDLGEGRVGPLGFAASPAAIHQVGAEVGGLLTLVDSARASAEKAERLAAREDEWGFFAWFPGLNPLPEIQQRFADLRENVGLIREGVSSFSGKLRATAESYSSVDHGFARFIGKANEISASRPAPRSDLNPVSQFYNDHRYLYGLALALPTPIGRFVSLGMDAWRFSYNITSDDKMNAIQDTLNAMNNLTFLLFNGAAFRKRWQRDPLGWGIFETNWLILNGFLLAKDASNVVSGDPMASGQSAYVVSRVGKTLMDIAQDLTKALATLLDSWVGDAADMAAQQLMKFRDGVRETAENAYHLASMLQHYSSYMMLLEGFLKFYICDLVLSLIITPLAWRFSGRARLLPILPTSLQARAAVKVAQVMRPAFVALKNALSRRWNRIHSVRSQSDSGENAPKTMVQKFMSRGGSGYYKIGHIDDDKSRGWVNKKHLDHTQRAITPGDVFRSWYWHMFARVPANRAVTLVGCSIARYRPNRPDIIAKYGTRKYPLGRIHLPERFRTGRSTRVVPRRYPYDGLPFFPKKESRDIVCYYGVATNVSLIAFQFWRAAWYGHDMAATPDEQVKQNLVVA